MRRALRAFGPALVWAAVIIVVGGLEDVGPKVDLPVDKAAHFFMYGVLGALAGLGWRRAGGRLGRAWPFVVILLLGAGDELRQRAVAGRSSEFADWVADAAGALVGYAWMVRRVQGTRERGGDES